MENTPVADEVAVPKKNVLFEVTPVSRVLATILFIILPFVGFWIGYTYGSNNSITNVSTTVAPNTKNQIVASELNSQVNTVTDTTTQAKFKDILFNGQKTGYATDGAVVFYIPPLDSPCVRCRCSHF